jgi:hypothetical protein
MFRNTYCLAFHYSLRQRRNVHGYAKLMPILDIRDVSSIKTVEPNNHGIFECFMGFRALTVFFIPSEKIAHTIEFLGYVPFLIVREVRVHCEKRRYRIQVLE